MCDKCDCDQKIQELLERNEAWVQQVNEESPGFFQSLVAQQTPEYLWIGCSDSRVPANELVKMDPGTIFVHRNIANLINSSDMNALSVIQYAVEVLKVKHIIVNGHYGCGGVAAALKPGNPDLIDHWVRPIRKYYQRAKETLDQLPESERIDRLCEINVEEQVRNICHVPAVRKAWENGQELSVHGFIYAIKDGRLHNLNVSISSLDEADKMLLRDDD
ncbi:MULTISPECIES: carbonic anhydrase [Thiomicrorhabdus]|uniref:Carbonic anhydrase n=1 Tax=Thiomicrorhabdus heinhorstiae TaxID=2748010 RepID=A0ABS0C1Q3_9GAMM|nr:MULTISPECIES: carbonic anhydrase [Thiomicrorhabdus]MBF6058156.1 carbonic anhydrase [Thiomicrorhabdus heinhorstiae]